MCQQLCIFSAEGDLLWIALGSGTESLRKAGLDGVKEVTAAFRQAFPNVRLDLRADNGFACPELYDWCEDNHVTYFVNCGTAKNLQEKASPLLEWAECLFENQGKEQLTKVFASFPHRAGSWRAPRQIIAKAQRTIIGPDLRFIVTNSGLSATKAYEFYSGRGQMENWIKVLKLGVNSGRLSVSSFRFNSFRLLLFGLAYQLLHELRQSSPPALRNARIESIRLRLLRLAVRVKRSSRRLWVRFSKDLYSRDDWIATARALGV